MSKTTYVCRKNQNSELIKCVCAICESEKLRQRLAASEARCARLEAALRDIQTHPVKQFALSEKEFFDADRIDALAQRALTDSGDALQTIHEAIRTFENIKGFGRMEKADEFHHYLHVDIPSLCEHGAEALRRVFGGTE